MADHEIEDEIMVNLPYKCVVQFMCTSKHMYDRIRSPEFTKKYLDRSLRSNTNRCLLLSIPGPPTKFFALPLDDHTDDAVPPKRHLNPPFFSFTHRTEVVGHSAGLACVASHHYPNSLSAYHLRGINRRRRAGDNPTLEIWNPSLSTNHMVPQLPWFELPNPNPAADTTTTGSGGHILRLPPSYGFGLNPRTDVHEIVRLSQCFDPVARTYTTEVDIYNIESSWQSLASLDAARYERFEIGRGYSEGKAFGSPFLNGHMHWLMDIPVEDTIRILAFNVGNRGFTDYAVPPLTQPYLELYITGVGESLWFMEYQSDRIKVWRMTEYGNEGSWAMVYNVDSRYVADRFVSVHPLVESNTKGATLFLGNHSRTTALYGGTSYVQSFMMGDQPTCLIAPISS